MGICAILPGLMPNFWVYLVPMAFFAIVLPFYNTAATVLLQEHVEPDYLGSVFSLHTMRAASAVPPGMLVFGLLAERGVHQVAAGRDGCGNAGQAGLGPLRPDATRSRQAAGT